MHARAAASADPAGKPGRGGRRVWIMRGLATVFPSPSRLVEAVSGWGAHRALGLQEGGSGLEGRLLVGWA